MDTSPDASGANIKPRLIDQLRRIGHRLGTKPEQIRLDPAVFGSLKRHLGKDLLVTDGTTLLGADDKAGVADHPRGVVAVLARAIRERPHGHIRVVFTPDEEVGRGTDHLRS
ncbi:MAG: hypothetical protein MZU97_16680 [Bacillus subtilis]|nr:hypothetical protein [Bacillus subtilis]